MVLDDKDGKGLKLENIDCHFQVWMQYNYSKNPPNFNDLWAGISWQNSFFISFLVYEESCCFWIKYIPSFVYQPVVTKKQQNYHDIFKWYILYTSMAHKEYSVWEFKKFRDTKKSKQSCYKIRRFSKVLISQWDFCLRETNKDIQCTCFQTEYPKVLNFQNLWNLRRTQQQQ